MAMSALSARIGLLLGADRVGDLQQAQRARRSRHRSSWWIATLDVSSHLPHHARAVKTTRALKEACEGLRAGQGIPLLCRMRSCSIVFSRACPHSARVSVWRRSRRRRRAAQHQKSRPISISGCPVEYAEQDCPRRHVLRSNTRMTSRCQPGGSSATNSPRIQNR